MISSTKTKETTMRSELYAVTSEMQGKRKVWFVQMPHGRLHYRTKRRALQIADSLMEEAKVQAGKGYELAHAVFEVRNAIGHLCTPETLCVIKYVCLKDGRSRGSVISELANEIAAKHKTTEVEFKFWCDSHTADGGSPRVFEKSY